MLPIDTIVKNICIVILLCCFFIIDNSDDDDDDDDDGAKQGMDGDDDEGIDDDIGEGMDDDIQLRVIFFSFGYLVIFIASCLLLFSVLLANEWISFSFFFFSSLSTFR